jgi:hypothetical protein
MSRRDYIATAEILRQAVLTPNQRDDLADRFADACERENPKFDRRRFLAAVRAEDN